MSQEEVMYELTMVVRHVLHNDNVKLDSSSSAKDVDGWTSLTHMQIISELEAHFNIKFKMREIIKLKNIGDLCAAISSKIE
jgi:acyl carrier protein